MISKADRRPARERPIGEDESEPWRPPAQIDQDRIWYSTEFRRLEGVTQVVPPQDDYAFHDRLTHSIKVAQVAATLARKMQHEASNGASPLAAKLRAHAIRLDDWVSPDHCYAAGLAHDIGHPPFGHAGEAALQRRAETDSSGHAVRARSFEGNAQSTRIVATLSFRKPDSHGLNLTYRTLAAIAKYPWLRGRHPSSVPKLAKKWSFYESEGDILGELERLGFVHTERSRGRVVRVLRWPEAEIMDWADDISYAVHDLEDFFRSGRIPLHRIAVALEKAEPRAGGETAPVKHSYDAGKDVEAAINFARQKMRATLGEDGESVSIAIF